MIIAEKITEMIFPSRCPCCLELCDDSEPCEECAEKLAKCAIPRGACKKCGLEKNQCRCKTFNYLFEGISVPYCNTDIAKESIYSFKFRNYPNIAGYFGKRMAEEFKARFPDVNPDFVCIVPSGRENLKNRYYDYVKLLGKTVAKELCVPFEPRTLKKVKKNVPQHILSQDERQKNVKGVYAAKYNFVGKTVLLVDDIKTTGYTLNECAKQLRLAGADSVYCVTAIASDDNLSQENEKNDRHLILR